MAVNCRKCRHFKVTWEKARPYACVAFNFKSFNLPSVEVYKASGKECLQFSPRIDKRV